jgi:LCP family protein required for cell wall assembly
VGNDLFLAVDDGSGWRIVGGEWPDVGVAAYYGSGPRLIAVVGSDARTGEPVDETRADSIHFVALDGAGGGAVVGLPRDSYVPVPGYGTRKITGSLALGGPDVMMESFRNLTGLPLEGYVLTGFAGFQGLIEILGGVEVEVPFAINDVKAKAALSAGLQVLSGFDALAFARARKTVPGGDFTRSEHQGDILVAAAQGVRAMGPLAIPSLMEAAELSFLTDLSPEQLLTFSVLATKWNLDEMPNIVAPGSPGWAGSASVVYLADAAYGIFADLSDGRLGD